MILINDQKDNKLPSERTARNYIINLQKNRSIIALVASIVSLLCAVYGINYSIVQNIKVGQKYTDLFQYFTIDSNILAAFASAMIIPYAIEGIRKKRFYCPKWAMFFYFCGTVLTTLIFLFTVLVIRTYDPDLAFRGSSIYLHLICPTMILVSFLSIESYYRLVLKDVIYSIIPIFIYALIYVYNVIIVGIDNGGWEDIYYFTIYAPAPVSFILMMLMSFLVAIGIRFLYNKLSNYRLKKLSNNLWDENVSPIEIKIEIFGLGRYMGKMENKSYVTFPLDIILLIADKYNIKEEDLIAVFTKGMLDSILDNKKSDNR